MDQIHFITHISQSASLINDEGGNLNKNLYNRNSRGSVLDASILSCYTSTSCHFFPLKKCNRIAEILLNRALRGKDQRWCSNLKCTNAPQAHQTLHYNHQTWSPVETLGPKIGAGKVLWDSNNCTSRYSNCSYNQTRKPKLHSESID